jgi:hypothetical protein
LQKVARRLIFGNGKEALDFQTEDQRKKISKFKEFPGKCVYFLSAEIFALSVTYDEPWFTDTKKNSGRARGSDMARSKD